MAARIAPDTKLAIETGCWLAIAAGMWFYSMQFDADLEAYRFGPVSWPRGIMILIALVALIHFFHQKAKLGKAVPVASAAADPGTAAREADTWLRVGATFALPLAYLWFMPRAGFFITTPVFLALYMFVFRERSFKYVLLTTAGIYFVVLAVFSKLLFVPLPTGNWPGFYDFSNWLLELISSL